jgi:hypothetical protein
MKYLILERYQIVDNANLAQLVWPTIVDILQTPYNINVMYYSIPETHKNISLILLRIDNPIWIDLPVTTNATNVTNDQQVRIFA